MCVLMCVGVGVSSPTHPFFSSPQYESASQRFVPEALNCLISVLGAVASSTAKGEALFAICVSVMSLCSGCHFLLLNHLLKFLMSIVVLRTRCLVLMNTLTVYSLLLCCCLTHRGCAAASLQSLQDGCLLDQTRLVNVAGP